MTESGVVASPQVVAGVQRSLIHWCLARPLPVPVVCRLRFTPVYGKEPFSVYLRFEGVSDRISSSADHGLKGVYGKDMISVPRLRSVKVSNSTNTIIR